MRFGEETLECPIPTSQRRAFPLAAAKRNHHVSRAGVRHLADRRGGRRRCLRLSRLDVPDHLWATRPASALRVEWARGSRYHGGVFSAAATSGEWACLSARSNRGRPRGLHRLRTVRRRLSDAHHPGDRRSPGARFLHRGVHLLRPMRGTLSRAGLHRPVTTISTRRDDRRELSCQEPHRLPGLSRRLSDGGDPLPSACRRTLLART